MKLDTNIIIAAATSVYAIGTLLLAYVTARTGKSTVEATARNVATQVEASREAAQIQARASSISNNRQAWINAVRDEVTGFLTEASMAPIIRDDMHIGDPHRPQQQFRVTEAMRRRIYKIELLINPTEGPSTQLLDKLQAAYVGGLTDEAERDIIEHTQRILKTEWERVKSGE